MMRAAISLPILFIVVCFQSVHAEDAPGEPGDKMREASESKHGSSLHTVSQQTASSSEPEVTIESLQPSSDSRSASVVQSDNMDSVDTTVAISHTVDGYLPESEVVQGDQSESVVEHTTPKLQGTQEADTDTTKAALPDHVKVHEEVSFDSEKDDLTPEQPGEPTGRTSADDQVTEQKLSVADSKTEGGEESGTPPEVQSDVKLETGAVSGDSKVENSGSKIADFQSYSEWRQKVLEEEQKSKQDNTAVPVTQQGISPKQKLKINFSSKNCGAKVLVSNPEAENVQGVLTNNKDDYMLNPCSVQKKWFTVELCEPVQVKTVEIASLELFSSQPKTFRLFLSDRFPAKEWREIGEFQAGQEKTPQAFQIDDNQFVKFVKVELVDHYGSEHFCPVTLFRLYGVPMADDEDEDSNEDPETTHSEEETGVLQDGEEDEVKDNSRNLFMSAKDTVLNLVKKVLNVEEVEKDLEEKQAKEAVLGANYSHDGYLLPCVPELDEKVVDQREGRHVPSVKVPVLGKKHPRNHKDIPIVTKLQDDEQIPSEHRGDQKLVTLVSADQIGTLDLCGASVQNKSIDNKTSPHRMVCSYVQTMLSNKIEQSCSPHLETSSSAAGFKSQVVKATPVPPVTSDSSAQENSPSLDKVAENLEVQSISSSLSTPSVPSHGVSTLASVSASQSVKEPSELTIESQEASDKQFNTDAKTSEDISAPQHTSVVENKGTSELLAKHEQVVFTFSESSSSFVHTKYNTEVKSASHLEPSGSTSLEENTELLTQTPVLETQQFQTAGTETLSTEKSSLSVKVSPSPASEVASSEGCLPTKVTANVKEEEVVGELEEQKDMEEQEVLEQGTKAENATVSKDKTIDLTQVPLIPVAKRETAIMRLTNRIKALELNVSLSSRFLDELSHRFKKQSEDMMRLLNKTIAHFTNVSNRAELTDSLQQEQLDKLEMRVENLTVLMSELSVGMEELNNKMTDRQLVWSSVEFVLLVIVCVVCLRRGTTPSLHPDVQHLLDMMPRQPLHKHHIQRRNSVGTVGHVIPSTPIKKQASESALATVAGSDFRHNYEIVEQRDMLLTQQPSQKDGSKKKKKKKHKNLESKSSTEAVGSDGHETESLSATKLNKTAGLLFGADAVTVLTGGAHPNTSSPTADMKSSPAHKSSTKSLPTHSRQSSQTFTEIQKVSAKISIPPKKASVNGSDTASQCIIPPRSLPLEARQSFRDCFTVPSSSMHVMRVNSDVCQDQSCQAPAPVLTNGSPTEKSSKTVHIWKSADPHYPSVLKSSKATTTTTQQGLSFKKSFGFE